MSEPSLVATFQSDRPCRGCGLNLRGLPVEGACPDCGAKQAAAPAISKLSGTINWDLKCVRCAYVLKGLDRGAACPECGLSIAESLRPTTLRTHSMESLRKARGALIGVSVGVIGLILAVVLTVIGWSSAFGGGGVGMFGFGLLARSLTRETALAVCAISAILFVRELTPKSMERGGRPGSATVTVVGAWMMLVCSLLILGLNAVLLATGWTTFNRGGGGTASGAMMALGSLTAIVWLPTMVGIGLAYFGGLSLFKWVGQQCGSVPVYKRASRLTILSISLVCAVPVMYFVAFIGIAAMFGGLGGGGTGGTMALIALPLLLLLGMLVAVVMLLTLLRMVRRELGRLIESIGEPGAP